ncbi:MAG TPA: FKBP-type peptidyl-prolyl cis-trans isomerase [Kribbellaceae bacterium]|nr:FKBP-type peptidyl-prolyl cis-trans isomerase [Kribbellaceae bacterium]
MRKLLSLVAVLALGSSMVACSSEGGSGGDFGQSGVKVTEDFGKKPTITHREGDPDKSLVTEVLKEGSGPVVNKGDLLLAHYIGQIWRDGKVFDNSYDRGAPSAFPIGTGGVIKGWDEGLVGKKAGSRVLLSIPPDKGYGATGQTSAGIQGTDTLIFVVDLIAGYSNTTKLDATPVADAKTGGPVITGDVDAEPAVTVPKGTKPPATPGGPIVLADGNGQPIVKGSQLVGRYVIYDYTGKKQFSTWTGQSGAQGQQAGPTAQLQVGAANGQKSPLDVLIGTTVGSRVLLHLPAQKDPKGKPVTGFAVIDILNAFPAPKQ